MNPSMLRKLAAFILTLAVALAAMPAFAEVKREGTWPESDKNVSLEVSGAARADAVRKLADAAGWSIVADGVGGGAVDLHIKDQPPGRVLELVLDDQSYVASREGTLVRIRRASPPPAAAPAETPAVPAVPPAPPAPPEKPEGKKHKRSGEDRTIFGSNARIEAGEVVDDVTVFGGNVEVLGHVTGDLTVFGGNVHVKEGARVDGDASLLGGNLTLDKGTSVGKDVSVLGGNLQRDDGATVGGDVDLKNDGKLRVNSDVVFGDEHEHGFLGRLGSRLTNMAILFVFGTILLALGSARMESMRIEIAARPMRAFALGVVAFFAAILAVIVLCITIIGIPFAAVGTLLAVFAGYAGATAALTTFGAAVLQHRTQSPYVHLAFGCTALFVVGMIPFVGGFVTVVVAALGLGAVVGTRAAGLLSKNRNGNNPYRTPGEGI